MKTTKLLFLLFCVLGTQLFAQLPPSWVSATSIGGTLADDAADVVTDNTGNVYVIGSFQSNPMEVGTLTATNKGGKDIYVAKYTPAGVPIWLKTFGSTTDDVGYSIISDGTDIYWTGTFTNNLYYNPTNFIAINGVAGKPNIAIVKMDATGNVIWTNQSGGEGFLAYECYPNDIKLLTGGGVVVAGKVIGEMKWGTTSVGFTVKDTCYDCGFISRYGQNTGEYEWTYTVRPPAHDTAYDCTAGIFQISVDNNDNIYAIGNMGNRLFNKPSRLIFPHLPLYGVGTPGVTTIDGLGQFNFFLLKIAADALFSFAKTGGFGTPGNYSDYFTTGSAIWVDKAAQHIYLGGGFWDSYYYNGAAAGTVSSAGGNAYLIKTDLNGEEIWERHSTTTSTTSGNSLNQLSGNGKGGVYMGISLQADCDWYGHVGSGNSSSGTNVMLGRIEADGSTRYTKIIDAGGFHYIMPPQMHAISSPTTDECWVAGLHDGFGIYFDTYLVSGNNYSADGYVAKLGTSSPLALAEPNSSNFELYPNPSEGNFAIELPTIDKGMVIISDATGREVYQQEFQNTKQVGIQTDLPSGIYFVQVLGEKSYQSIKWNNCK